ncbi:carbohydrate ABC transporter permease [Deinococcus marmoris]|uniref:L-arabinose transport system permease protein araP n=1 Tax=Deinococcus marmoris TaxID=249408 RepID=A0A1U7NWD6_9DEIO|nr:sugar ABC transporter permease [Deinococcus marmoris]OLV17232.1 L-arabinose transport system permease protein araP [Deinococcus marmoris]OLV18707.1 sugar ABC transporter, permease protein [Deinococcus marmoris]
MSRPLDLPAFARPARPARRRKHLWPMLFIAPFFVLFLVFGVYPVIFSAVLSFQEWNGAPGQQVWVGWQNYASLFQDRYFWSSMTNSVLIFLLHFPVMTLGGLVLAVILNENRLRFQGLWRAMIFLPHLTSMVAAGITFRLLFERDSGLVNRMLGGVGIPAVPWLDNEWWARVAVGILLVWAWTGYQMVIFLSALQTIPGEVNEAALIDGAGRVQVFWKITVPLMRPAIVFVTTLSVIGTFALYTEPVILTGGGPIHATTTPTMEIYAQAFNNIRYGYGAALSYVYFAIVVAATLLQLRLTNRGQG